MNGSSARPLVKAAHIAEILSVPPSWVYFNAREGNIPCHHIGRYVRFDAEAVMDWLSKL